MDVNEAVTDILLNMRNVQNMISVFQTKLLTQIDKHFNPRRLGITVNMGRITFPNDMWTGCVRLMAPGSTVAISEMKTPKPTLF
jgi:hypothetical protein